MTSNVIGRLTGLPSMTSPRASEPNHVDADNADRVVHLDDLGTGVAHLLDGVEENSGVHSGLRIGDPHPDSRPLGWGRAGQDGQLSEVLFCLLPGHPLGVGT